MNILQKWQVEKDKKNLSLLISELKKLNLSKKVFELYENFYRDCIFYNLIKDLTVKEARKIVKYHYDNCIIITEGDDDFDLIKELYEESYDGLFETDLSKTTYYDKIEAVADDGTMFLISF